MATPNTKNIYVGSPDQLTTGAIFTAPLGTALPADASTALSNDYTSSGYVSEEGLSLNGNKSITRARAWGRKIVRILTESVEPELSFALLEMSEESCVQAFGEDAVTVTAATADHGKQITIAVDGSTPEAKVWVFNMKDGDARVRLVFPNAVVTNVPDMTFTDSELIQLPITLAPMADASGKFYYIHTDDGQSA